MSNSKEPESDEKAMSCTRWLVVILAVLALVLVVNSSKTALDFRLMMKSREVIQERWKHVPGLETKYLGFRKSREGVISTFTRVGVGADNVIVVAYFLKTGYCVTTRCLSFQGVDMRHPDFYSKMESD